MNIDELIAEISSEDFEFSLDSMTEQELSDLYQRLLDADDELQVRLTNLQESEPKPSQEEFEEVVANKRKIEDANQRVSEKWAQLLNTTPVNEQTPEQVSQNIEEQIKKLKNNEEENDFESVIEKNVEQSTLDANNEPIALNEIEDSMSINEKIDSIEKQMDTLFHQIAQAKYDITRNKLSDKYFDLSNQLEALKQQLKEGQTLNNKETKDSMSTDEKIVNNSNDSSENDFENNNSRENTSKNENNNNSDIAPEEDSSENEEKDNEKTEEEKKEERKQKIKKAVNSALVGALGGAVGFGLSFVLQPGTAGMVISVGRLVYSTSKKVSKSLKISTEKHMDDKINPIVKKVWKLNDKAIEGIEKGKKQINELLTSIPVINSFVHNVNNLLKKPETQIFLNGMAAGYTIGKISQWVYKMHEAAATEKPGITDEKGDGKKTNINPDDKPEIDPDIDKPTQTPPSPVPEHTFDPSKPVDLSSIKNGYVSSYSSDPVSLMTSAGKGAFFDKVNVVNGKTWVHFTQANGAGYAWFPAEDVMDALNISDISELTGKVSGGMHL